MKRTHIVILAGLLILTAVGCGTVKGIGDDISTVGRWVTKGADNASK